MTGAWSVLEMGNRTTLVGNRVQVEPGRADKGAKLIDVGLTIASRVLVDQDQRPALENAQPVADMRSVGEAGAEQRIMIDFIIKGPLEDREFAPVLVVRIDK